MLTYTCHYCLGTGREHLDPAAAAEQRAEATDLGPDDDPPDGTVRCPCCNGRGELTEDDLNWELDCN